MKKPMSVQFAKPAILTLAEIKAAVEAFDCGDTNVFDALDAIIVAVEAHQAAMASTSQRKQRGRDAA
jgi:phosphopantetheine adenylyltransferase